MFIVYDKRARAGFSFTVTQIFITYKVEVSRPAYRFLSNITT